MFYNLAALADQRNLQCAGCSKTIVRNNAHRIGFQPPGQPEEIKLFCKKCALRIARDVVAIERRQIAEGVLK